VLDCVFLDRPCEVLSPRNPLGRWFDAACGRFLGLDPFVRCAARAIHVTFIDKHGEETTVDAAVGDTLLDVAQDHGIDIEGACEGECACSTCHVILEQAVFDKLPHPTEAEEDMLDLAAGLTSTSRLGCQVELKEDFDGMRVQLPAVVTSML
jgi:ferredoxin-2, mitochondrial